MSSSSSVSIYNEFSGASNRAIEKVIEMNKDIHSVASSTTIFVVKNKASSDMSSSEEDVDL